MNEFYKNFTFNAFDKTCFINMASHKLAIWINSLLPIYYKIYFAKNPFKLTTTQVN